MEIDFSANINPFGTPSAVLEAVTASLPLLCQYPDPYCRELVEAIGEFEQVPKDWILCGNGAADLIFALCNAQKPRKAMVLAPCFSEYETALNAVGCQVDHFFLTEERGFALPDSFTDTLRAWDGDLLMLCNPNNPTGQVIPKEQMEEILNICREKRIFLFIDECFLDLTQGGDTLSMKDKLEDYDNLLLLKAFTKSYGMAGLRLGYCLSGNRELLRAMGCTTQAWNVSIPAQKAGVAALKQRSFLAKANALIHAERPRMMAVLEKLGFSVVPSRVNYILFHSDIPLREPLMERGIQIRSCANYHGLGEGWYRVAVKLPEQNDRLLSAMEEIRNG